MEKVWEKSGEVKSAYDAPPDPLVGWGGGQPIPSPAVTTPTVK